MDSVSSTPLPRISVSPPPPEEPMIEPCSPFTFSTSPLDIEDDGFRTQHLTPPPTNLFFNKPQSPTTVLSKGLDKGQFSALLRATRERNLSAACRKDINLRKEIALKAHKNKQAERRAIFLSKVLAPPSPSATCTPKTPPESPAIFHYSLPSPGLMSPLSHLDSIDNSEHKQVPLCKPWVEQVDFRRPGDRESLSLTPKKRTPCLLPSLDQITARMCSRASAVGFANSHDDNRPRLPVSVGRLKMPARKPISSTFAPPVSPLSIDPNIQVTTLVVPRTRNISPNELSESNLQALGSRERCSHDMLLTLRRRVTPSDHPFIGREISKGSPIEDNTLRKKRHSAPADLTPLRSRLGFEHPVLAMAGGF